MVGASPNQERFSMDASELVRQGVGHHQAGRLHEALECYRSALKYAPNFFQAASNLLMCLNYDPDADREAIFREHRHWGQRMQSEATPLPPANNLADPERRLRIGYVSPDFRK